MPKITKYYLKTDAFVSVFYACNLRLSIFAA